ncbi:ABC transporter substrate-binding protein [Pseudonocardia sp. C8]|uniref:ABC transporter substrate-binding protein n=1 Tax=Pseudonocardia sp. C8 TaxID=2762759 RepID=UPI0016428590|nr:ABC transporter substrate-binding protein [Pseudonocardia sp. C8]MBC3192703.1 ABC transporter substrate-binding protein [Pseudonocardia sp. C8]
MPHAVPRTLAACAVLLVLTGCTAGGAPGATGQPPPAGAFPVTLHHAFGSTTIAAPPRRVVAIGYNEADFVMALGVQPVAEREFQGDFDWQRRAWLPQPAPGPTPQVLAGSTPSVEQVAALKPDLILGVYSFLDRATYDALSRIAPTVAQPTADGSNAARWDTQTRITGQALGRTAQADQVIAATRARFEEAERAHPGFAGKRLRMAFFVEGAPWDLGTDDLRAQLFDGLGFEVRPDSQQLSLEQQGRLDGDVVVVMGRTRAEAEADPVFSAVPAVREGRVVYLGGFATELAGALGYSSPLSLPYAIDTVAPQLDAALQGRPQGG